MIGRFVRSHQSDPLMALTPSKQAKPLSDNPPHEESSKSNQGGTEGLPGIFTTLAHHAIHGPDIEVLRLRVYIYTLDSEMPLGCTSMAFRACNTSPKPRNARKIIVPG